MSKHLCVRKSQIIVCRSPLLPGDGNCLEGSVAFWHCLRYSISFSTHAQVVTCIFHIATCRGHKSTCQLVLSLYWDCHIRKKDYVIKPAIANRSFLIICLFHLSWSNTLSAVTADCCCYSCLPVFCPAHPQRFCRGPCDSRSLVQSSNMYKTVVSLPYCWQILDIPVSIQCCWGKWRNG